MNPKYINLSNEVNKLLLTKADKSADILSAAIAIAIANASPLPSTPVESSASYFTLTVQPSFTNILSSLNEDFMFSIKGCISNIEAFWKVRYSAAHPSFTFYNPENYFFDDFFKVSEFVSADLKEILTSNSEEIFLLVEKFKTVVSSVEATE